MKKKTIKRELDENHGFLETLVKAARRANAGTAVVANKNCKAWDGCDTYVVYAANGVDKADTIKAFVDAVCGDDE